ncbi:uncharacterized protein LOC129610098 isoform X1 [Condylostylus longicornis]|uniref:uncharacterized protein LOC129610098 isoform X1 n=1 Tax=Condylostylus longicornis TaxID=2530218 RepID=UPI00244E12FA|nr:uncharacterized protein LOC129610098 isoform X1 [Condylostylus longicornis]
MELGKKSQKVCKKLRKIKPEPPEKKIKTDTPCKRVDARCLVLKKKINCDKNKLNQIEKKNIDKNKNFNNLDHIKKEKVNIKKLNKNYSSLTESKKEETCDDKMTKVAAPVVKMVEPLFELIDFEEEIKVEKISKEECKTPEVELKNYSDEEIKIEKNIIRKISRKKKLLVKDILNIVASETYSYSNSNDSHSSENSNKSSKSDACILPRRNPSRRISLRDEVATKLISEKVNVKKEVKKSFPTNRNTRKVRGRKTQKSLNSLTNESSLNLEKDISKIEKSTSITLSHVPTENQENEVSTSEESINNDKPIEIPKPTTLLTDNSSESGVSNKNNEPVIQEILQGKASEKCENESNKTCNIQQVNDLEPLICTEKENSINMSQEISSNIPMPLLPEEQNNVVQEAESKSPMHETQNHIHEENLEKDINISTSSIEKIPDKQLEEYTVKDCNIADTKSDIKNTNITDIKIESKTMDGLNETNSDSEEIENKHEISKTDISISETSIETKIELTTNIKIENEIDIQKTDLDETMNEKEILSDEKSFTENKIEINSNEDVKEKKISEEKVFSSDESKTNGFDNSKQRFFIFGDEIEEECSSCKIGMETKEISKVNEQICGEIIHKTQEDFSINCYMCWDENNWTFKKFNDLKLFSTHLNTEHTNDEISFQNKRGNSYSLDFVNENSCVMPQSMWFGIYNEMIMFKCGFAKIDTNGYILYSCLECQHAFKNFNTFTKHILGRETKEQKIGEHEENMSPIVSDNMSVSSTNKSDIKDCEKEKSYVKNPALIESCKEFAKEIECNNIDNENNKETSQFKEKNEDNADNNQNSMQEPHIFLPKPKSILESILESAKVNKENSDQEDKSPTLLLESIDPNVNIPTEKKIEENLPDLVSHAEINKKSSNEEHVPDTYNYKQITTALFDIFKEGEEEPASSKLNKILSVGESYRSIKEKEKMDLEEREKQKILSLSIQKDTRPRIEGANIVTKHILDLNDKLALLTCKYCSRRYTCLTNLREHFRIHVGDRMVICYKCKRGFSKKSNLEEHINIFHLDSSDKNIDLDVLGDNRKEIAKNTNITVNENNPKEKGFKCKYCIRFLSNRTVLEDHLRLHFGEKPLKCEKCDLQFLKKSIFDNHVMEVHELRENDGPLENFEGSCNKENNKAFSNKAKNKFKCKQCPETFPTKVGLIEHLIMNHNDGEFKCRFCDLRFSSKKKRSYHEKLHKDGAKFQCNFCDQCFSNLFSLETHESSHKINADFKCRFCDHYFASDKTRILHEEMHETTGKSNNNMQIQTVDIATILQMNNEQAPINSNGNANDSNGTSSDATDRSSNQNTASKNLMVKKIIKKIKRGKRDPNSPLDCRYCKKHFESPHQLSYHERLHEIGKKFQCNICDKILATSYALELHLTAHLRKKNFPKNNFNLKYNGSNMLTNQLTMPMKVDFKPKIEIVSDVTLAPTETMEILNNFFKRDLPEITVTTTSDDESFQKIGVNDIEKNLAAHVLRDTDPYYQLMADFSYQYQMYQMQSALKMENMNFAEISPNNITSGDSEIFDRPKKSRKKKLTIEKVESTIETSKTNLSSPNDQNDLYIENKNIELENPPQELLQNKMQLTQQDNLNTSKDPIKKKDKKKLIPDNNKSLTNVFIKCEYCNKKLNSSDKKLLSRHRRLHIAGDTHKCSFCNKCFATLYYLDKHLRVHHLNKVIQYQCPSCDSVYVLKEALRRHEQRAHKENNSNPKIESKEKEINKIDDNINKTSDIDSSCLESNINDIGDNQFKDQEFAIPEIPKKTNKRSRSKELKLFDCDFCEKAFPTFSSLQTHIDKTHKKHVENFEENYSFKCSYENCKKKFDCQTNLDKHYRLHESGFKCSICNKKTISQISLDNHMKSHGMPISFGCKFCKSKFTMQLTKDIHERKNHNKGSIYVHPRLVIKKLGMCKRKTSYRCYNCKKSFSSLILLKTHNMYKHPVYECNTCPAIFSKINDLEEHEKIHLKTLQCNLCEKTFENKHTLYKHRRQHETKFFKCNMCPAEFSFRDELNEHKKNHDESERPFKCVELGCDKAFVVETFLNTHLKKIHGYFLFNCDRCKREFLNEDLLTEHRKEHDLLPVDKQYRCDQCFKDFSTPTILKIHQKLHQSSVVAAAADSQTPDPQKTSKLKLYTCEQCDKRFSIVTYLNNHLKKVHQVKLFVCEHCKMEFRNEKDLQEHSKVHLTGKKFIRVEKTHLDRPFKCELCGNSYAILAYLNNHLNKAHGNEETLDEPKKEDLKNNHAMSNTNGNSDSFEVSKIDNADMKMKTENEVETNTTVGNNDSTLFLNSQNAKKNNSIKCDHCYLRFISSKYLKEHSKMHLDPNDSSRIEMLESAFNPQRSEKILKPIINSGRSNSNNNNTNSQSQQQKIKAKKISVPKIKKKPKKQPKLKTKAYDEDSSSSVELIEVSEPPDIPEHNLSYTQITEALTSASSGLTAIQPVEVIESPNDDDQQMTTELTPLTTLTSLSSLTPLTPLQPTAVFHHSSNDTSVLQSQQQSQLQVTNSAMELTSLEPSTISEATKLSLTLLEPSALCELTAFTEPSVVPMHTANLTDLTSPYDQSTSILHHDHTILGDLASSSTTSTFEAQLITTQCNNSSATLNTSSASSDYAVTNMDTSQITQQSKKPRISDSNMHLESFTMLDDNSSQTEHNSQSELTNFSTFDSTTAFLSTKTDQNMMFTDLNMSTKSIMSDSASLEPLTYSDSMPLSEATTILELTSSSQPTSSSEATAFSESNNNATLIQSSSGKKKRNSGGKSRGQRPTDSEILNLEGDFDMCCENKNFKCTLCQRVYDSWTKFRKHNECHALRPHQCPICPCNFKTDEELFEHKAAHERSEKNFSCEICNRVFISKSRLKAHMLTVHNEEREYKCEYCPSAFKTKSRLVDHTRCHTGEKPIKCHYCDEHFSRAAYRLKHERALHLELLEIDLKNKEGKKEKKN